MRHVTTWSDRQATTHFQGTVSAEDFLRCAFELAADPRSESVAFFVADFLDSSGHAFDVESVREDLAAQALGTRLVNTRYKIVVVADDEGVDAFTAKMRALFANDGPEIVTFKTREEASRWMDAQDPLPNFRDTFF